MIKFTNELLAEIEGLLNNNHRESIYWDEYRNKWYIFKYIGNRYQEYFDSYEEAINYVRSKKKYFGIIYTDPTVGMPDISRYAERSGTYWVVNPEENS